MRVVSVAPGREAEVYARLEGRSVAGQLGIQITGVIAVLLWSLLLTYVIAKAVQAFIGLRVDSDTEEQGLDLRLHGERGYNM